jgi:hypothetical protein
MTKCKNCGKTIVPSEKYEGEWAHESPVPNHDADICEEIKTAEPAAETGVLIDFTAKELLNIAMAINITGETFNQFIERALREAVSRYGER